MGKVVFLDRDGVINVDKGYTHKIVDFELTPMAIEGLQKISSLGYKMLIITNQSGIGRGIYGEEDFWRFQNHLVKTLAEGGVILDGIYYCPHRPEDACGCRKPETGMIRQARNDFEVSLSESFLIGDSPTDIVCGKSGGLQTIFLSDSDNKKAALESNNIQAHYYAANLLDAAIIIEKLTAFE